MMDQFEVDKDDVGKDAVEKSLSSQCLKGLDLTTRMSTSCADCWPLES